jgi:hypothetical protein
MRMLATAVPRRAIDYRPARALPGILADAGVLPLPRRSCRSTGDAGRSL